MEICGRWRGRKIYDIQSITWKMRGRAARAPGVRTWRRRGPADKPVRSRTEGGSRPISRVLSRTAIPLGTRSPACSSDLPGGSASHAVAPYAVLLRMGFTLPSVLPRTRCALTAPFHPCQPRGAYGGVFSVALSVASRRPAVNRHPALWSPDFPLRAAIANLTQRLSSRLPAAEVSTPAHVQSGFPGLLAPTNMLASPGM